MRAPNEARGEVAVTVGKEDLIICIEMDGLARVSADLKTKTLQELYERLMGAEPNAIRSATQHFTVEGDGVMASKALKIPDLPKMRDAVIKAMAAHMQDEEGGNG